MEILRGSHLTTSQFRAPQLLCRRRSRAMRVSMMIHAVVKSMPVLLDAYSLLMHTMRNVATSGGGCG